MDRLIVSRHEPILIKCVENGNHVLLDDAEKVEVEIGLRGEKKRLLIGKSPSIRIVDDLVEIAIDMFHYNYESSIVILVTKDGECKAYPERREYCRNCKPIKIGRRKTDGS